MSKSVAAKIGDKLTTKQKTNEMYLLKLENALDDLKITAVMNIWVKMKTGRLNSAKQRFRFIYTVNTS